MRLAASDPELAARPAGRHAGTSGLPRATWPPWAWAHAARQAALKLQPEAAAYCRASAWRAWDAHPAGRADRPGATTLLAWKVRAALRQPDGRGRPLAAGGAGHRRDERRRAARQRLGLLARPRHAGARRAGRRTARRRAPQATAAAALDRAGSCSFYGKLAAEDLGGRVALPPPPRR